MDRFRSLLEYFAAFCGGGCIGFVVKHAETQAQALREAQETEQRVKAVLDRFGADLRSVLARIHAAAPDQGRTLADAKLADGGDSEPESEARWVWVRTVLMQLWDLFCCRIMQRLGDEFGDIAFDTLYPYFRALVIQHALIR